VRSTHAEVDAAPNRLASGPALARLQELRHPIELRADDERVIASTS